MRTTFLVFLVFVLGALSWFGRPRVKPLLPAKPSAYHPVVLIATGDVIPARTVNATMVRRDDFRYPFAKTKPLLATADILLINLEAPLIEGCPVTDEGMVFCGSARFIEGLIEVGVDIANLANNHSGNYGSAGLQETANLLKRNQIKTTGLKRAAIVKVKNRRFGFLGYNDIEKDRSLPISLADPVKIKREIKKLKQRVDNVIVSFHWGEEYTPGPTNRQKELAHLAVDSGADLVVGNHPHWVQFMETYKGKVINYALGNFIFDQMWSQRTRKGVIAKYVFRSQKPVRATFYPVVIENYSQPRLANSYEVKTILNYLHALPTE